MEVVIISRETLPIVRDFEYLRLRSFEVTGLFTGLDIQDCECS
jgi:hypothetical protein